MQMSRWQVSLKTWLYRVLGYTFVFHFLFGCPSAPWPRPASPALSALTNSSCLLVHIHEEMIDIHRERLRNLQILKKRAFTSRKHIQRTERDSPYFLPCPKTHTHTPVTLNAAWKWSSSKVSWHPSTIHPQGYQVKINANPSKFYIRSHVQSLYSVVGAPVTAVTASCLLTCDATSIAHLDLEIFWYSPWVNGQ